MDYSGNRELLDEPLVAFFASRTYVPNALELSQQWAYTICKTDKVVISGFHSPIEREVLRILMSQQHPVVIALGRTLYRRVPVELQQAHAENRLLFISLRNQDRHSFSNAQTRNWIVSDFAEEVVFAPFTPESQLSTLCYTLSLREVSVRVLGVKSGCGD